MNRRTALLLLGAGGASTAVAVLAACSAAPPTAPSATVGAAQPTAAAAAPTSAPATPPAAPTSAPAAPTGAAAAAATGGAASPTRAAVATTPGSAAAAAQPRRGGTLRSAITADLANLEPHVILPNAYESLWLVYDRLTDYDDKLKPQPMLAESWDVSPDYRQIKLNLRKGVQFHSGREFTSDDVKYNFLRVRDPKVGASVGFRQSVELVHQHRHARQVHRRPQRPISRGRPCSTSSSTSTSSTRTPLEGPDAKTKAVGTGPFIFVRVGARATT